MVRTVQAQSKKNDISVIALDSSASAKLRKNNISHETPLKYLSRSYNDDALTRKAVALARSWYEPFGQSLFFDGISLGEIVEYDFVFLFNDVVRSIEIAKEIMRQIRPDEIVLPGNATFGEPNTICYEALSPALSYLAALKGVETTVIRPDPEHKLTAFANSFQDSTRSLAIFFADALGQTRSLYSKKSTKNDTHKKRILVRIPSAHLIQREIDSNNATYYHSYITTLTGYLTAHVDSRPKKLIKSLAAVWEDFTKSPRFVTSLKIQRCAPLSSY